MKMGEAIQLIRHHGLKGEHPSAWADLGCGSGVFTLALASLLYPGSRINAIDQNEKALKSIDAPEGIQIDKIKADFTLLDLGPQSLNGILMANSLHYVKDQTAFLKRIASSLLPAGRFLIVEYDLQKPNPWVPYPLAFLSLQTHFEKAGWKTIEKINEMPSAYGRANLYSALVGR